MRFRFSLQDRNLVNFKVLNAKESKNARGVIREHFCLH